MKEDLSESGRLSLIRDLIRWWTEKDAPAFETVAAAGAEIRKLLAGFRVLVIIDDAWNPSDIDPLKGLESGATLLITTRVSHSLPENSNSIPVDAMATSEAIALLRLGLNCEGSCTKEFGFLTARLGEWALLLKLVNGTLRKLVKGGLSVSEALQRANEDLDEEGFSAFDQNDPGSRHAAASKTILVSIKRLSERDRDRYSQLAIFLEDENIPLSVLERYWELTPSATRKLCDQLTDLSLLGDFDQRGKTIRLHDVMRQVLIEQRQKDLPALHLRFLSLNRPSSGQWKDLSEKELYVWKRLAYHLLAAGLGEELRELLILSPFLEAKLRATAVNDLLADYETFNEEDQSLRLVRDALRLSAHVLVRDRKQLAPQLLGRLLGQGTPSLYAFMEEAKLRRKWLWLRPRTGSLIHPGGALLRTLEGHLDEVNAVAMVDDRYAVSASSDRTLRVWDLESGETRQTLRGHIDWVNAVAVVDVRRAISGSTDDTLRIWDLEHGTALKILEGHTAGVSAVAIVDGRRVISSSFDRTLRVWDLESGQTLQILRGHEDWVNAVAVATDGRAVSASTDETLRVWDVETGQTLQILRGHTAGVRSVAMMADGRAVSASADRTLRIWDLASGRTLQTLQGHTDEVRVVAALAGCRALSASLDGTVRVWNIESGQVLRTLQRDKARIRAVAVVNRDRIVSADADGALRLWDLEGRQTPQPPRHQAWVRAMVVVDCGHAVSADADGALRVWDLESGQTLQILRGHRSWVSAVATMTGDRVISASSDQTLRVWDLKSGQTLQILRGHMHWVNAVAVLPEGRAISASAETLWVWDLESGQILQTLPGHRARVNAVAALDAGRAISASNDGTLRLWDLESGQTLRILEGHRDKVSTLAVLPDGRTISGSADRTLRVWDLESGQMLQTLRGHTEWIRDVAVLAGDRAVSASFDCTLRIWNLGRGEELTVTTLDAPVWAVAASSDRKLVVMAGDGSWEGAHLSLMEPDVD